ncbi:hypothetical protein MAR_019584 [Mya arenaria]|uniref:Uncharacterized protein n=1 Tax=Mya arenaria TaxID=6604 RepID=A0ABY7E2Z2_MYAAR|nr:hypothetical protein MAR_019584 [Mya arenaria]
MASSTLCRHQTNRGIDR